MSPRPRAMGVLLLVLALGPSAPAQELSAPASALLPRSALEDRLWADLDQRLADPSAWQALVNAEAPAFYEGHLFPYVLPVLALASRSRQPDADPAAIRAQMATLLDLLIPEVTRRLRAPSVGAIPEIRGYGTWQGELALALGAWRLAGGDGRYEALHARLCEALLKELQARAGAPIDAYPGLVWTFDTVPVLLALRVRDRTLGLAGAEEAIQAHLRWSDAHLDPGTGLPVSRLDLQTGRTLEGPRGADLGLRITLMAQLDHARAEALYTGFVKHFAVKALGMEGFGEWPDGQMGRPDPDSGPVIAGLGMSSTGMGLGAAWVMGDSTRFARLDAELTAFPRLLAPMRPLLAPQASALGLHLDTDAYVTGLLLGDVALLWGLSWASWGVEGERHAGLEGALFYGVNPSDPPLDVFPEPMIVPLRAKEGCRDCLFGLMGIHGEWIAAPEFDEAEAAYRGGAWVRRGPEWALIDAMGQDAVHAGPGSFPLGLRNETTVFLPADQKEPSLRICREQDGGLVRYVVSRDAANGQLTLWSPTGEPLLQAAAISDCAAGMFLVAERAQEVAQDAVPDEGQWLSGAGWSSYDPRSRATRPVSGVTMVRTSQGGRLRGVDALTVMREGQEESRWDPAGTNGALAGTSRGEVALTFATAEDRPSRVGFVDEHGAWVVQPEFASAVPFRAGAFWTLAWTDRTWLVGRDGRIRRLGWKYRQDYMHWPLGSATVPD